MKLTADRSFADPEKAARKLLYRPKGWLWKHESGTYVKFTPAGAGLFA